jgi:hypothetical protein
MRKVIRPACEAKVGEAEERGDRRAADVVGQERFRNEDDHRKAGRHQHEQQRRNDAAKASRIKQRDEREKAGGLVSVQRAGDDEPGHDKENVNAAEAAGQQAGLQVIEHDRDDRERAKPVDVREIRPVWSFQWCGLSCDPRHLSHWPPFNPDTRLNPHSEEPTEGGRLEPCGPCVVAYSCKSSFETRARARSSG